MRGAKEVSIYGTRYEVRADVGVIRSMSAHGDYEDLSQWLSCQDPKDVRNCSWYTGSMMYRLFSVTGC